ncbi:MAG TPA: protease inhibitor I42 family protein [Solirubrobacteraceae bacterium]|jgi:predicted secreted protein
MTDIPDRIELAPGETRSFQLPGLGTAGYMWQDVVEGDPGTVEVSWERGFAPGTEPAAVGVSAPETATVRALGPGEAAVRLVQRRPWEQDVAPQAEHRMAVQVRD